VLHEHYAFYRKAHRQRDFEIVPRALRFPAMCRDGANDGQADGLLKGVYRDNQGRSPSALLVPTGLIGVYLNDAAFDDEIQRTSRPRGAPRGSGLRFMTLSAFIKSPWVNRGKSSAAGSTTSRVPSKRISTFSPAPTFICLAIAAGMRNAKLFPHLRTCWTGMWMPPYGV